MFAAQVRSRPPENATDCPAAVPHSPQAKNPGELSDTRVFDRPQAGRSWFEQTICDQLALGRPDRIAIVFARGVSRQTPGRFATEVISRGVEPAIQAHYRSSKVKQYLKEGRAVRTAADRGFAVGDRVVPLENARRLGVLNGQRGTVTSIDVDERVVRVALDAGREVELPAGTSTTGASPTPMPSPATRPRA